eukprot:4234347-Pyramimonas_sp.AAC.1
MEYGLRRQAISALGRQGLQVQVSRNLQVVQLLNQPFPLLLRMASSRPWSSHSVPWETLPVLTSTQ